MPLTEEMYAPITRDLNCLLCLDYFMRKNIVALLCGYKNKI